MRVDQWHTPLSTKYHSTDLLTTWRHQPGRHRISGSTSYEMTPPIQLETSGGMLSTVDMVVQQHNGPRQLRDNDDDDDTP